MAYRTYRVLAWMIIFISVPIVLAMNGCSDESSGKGSQKVPTLGESCTTNFDCNSNLVCSAEGFCVPDGCSSNTDCPDGFSCLFGECKKNQEIDGDDETNKENDTDGDNTSTDGENGPQPKIVAPESIDFGAVLMGASATADCEVSNAGDAPLTIWHISVSGGDAEGEFSIVDPPEVPLIIDPQMSYTFTLKYEPANPGADQGTFSIVSDDPTVENQETKVTLTSRYKGIPTLTIDKTEINFGLVLVDTENPPRENVTICNKPQNQDDNAVLEVSEIHLDEEYSRNFELENPQLPALLIPNDCIQTTIIFRPRERSVFQEHITIVSNDGNEDHSETEIPVSGRGAIPDISVDPGNVQFGQVKVHRCSDQVITISSTGDVPLVVRRVEIEPSCAGVFSLTDTPPLNLSMESGEHTSATVEYCPTARRIDVCFLKVWASSEEDENPQQPVIIPLQGEGVLGFISVYPNTIDFGSVEANHTASQPLEINNTSEVDVEVSSIEFLGPSYNFVLDTQQSPVNFPFMLAPNEQKLLWITYQPQTEGTDTCRMKVNVVEMGENSPEVVLSGSAVVPLIEITPQTLEFQNAQVNTTTTKNFTIRNNGTAPLQIAEVGLSPFGASAEFTVHTLGTNELLPGGSAPITVDYTPNGIGDDFVWLYVCTNASNAEAQSCTNCFCNDQNMNPHAVMMITHAISPVLSVEAGSSDTHVHIQTEPVHLINFGFLLENQSRTAWVKITNTGIGPLPIDSIAIDGPEQYTIESMETPNGASLPFSLTGEDEIIVHIRYQSALEGASFGALVITHQDMDSDQYPEYRVQLKANSGENTEPVAIVKSPPGEPAGDQGRRHIAMPEPDNPPCSGCKCRVTVDGSESYDTDEGDSITSYRWDCDPRTGCVWSGVGSPNQAQTDIGINHYGEQTIKLTVTDSNGGTSFETQDSVLVVDCQAYPTAAAVEKTSEQDDISVNIGDTVVFDGSYSSDPDGTIAEYYWYVCHIVGSECENEHGFGTGVEQAYAFTEEGDYVVSLEVVDDDGLRSKQRGTVNVHVGYNENLRRKAT